MPEKTLSPDRHLKFLATRELRNTVPSIRNTLEAIRKRPKLLFSRAKQFDEAQRRVSWYIQYPDEISGLGVEVTNLTNLIALAKDKDLHTIGDLSYEYQTEKRPSEEMVKSFQTAEGTFPVVAELIKSGEWDYLRELDDPGVITSALLIEGYGLFLERHYGIEALGKTYVRAVEEVLGIEYPGTELWKDVKPWVIEESNLFSEHFIAAVSQE